MKEFLKRIKADYLLSSVMCITLGIIFVIWKEGVISLLGSVLAIGMVVIGIIYLCSFFLNLVTNGMSVVMGILVLAVGIWFLIQPEVIVSLIRIVIGVLLLFPGFRGVKETLDAKRCEYSRWTASLVFAIICMVCGFVCVFNPFGVIKNAVLFIGIILIFNGVSNIWICTTATHAERDYARRHETVDVEFTEDKGKNDETDGI